ncbi:MAG: ATP-binding protein [Bacteroidales bacterium]|nr:ATP-binding protein [Bacteroidales bacterium]
MYIDREIEGEVLRGAAGLPVVTITGPRQSGKTTMIKHLFPDKNYISLENPDNYEIAKTDPRGFLNKHLNGVILDEVQRVPELLSYIQGIVDEYNVPGMFILSGSQQFNLMSGVSQSLAGRTAIFKLFPFNMSELGSLNLSTINEILYKGYYPRIWNSDLFPTKVYSDYIESYIERDLRQIVNIKDLDKFRTFVRLCAGRVGQVFIASHLANEIGVSVHTINSWLSILENSYIIFQLPPFHANINKRLIKSTKLYFYDVGLACNLLRIQQPDQLDSHPLRGALFENLIVADIIKSRRNKGLMDNFFFYRDSNQNEVDLIIDNLLTVDAVEIKSSETFNNNLLKGLKYIRKVFQEKTRKTYLCYAGLQEMHYQDHQLVNFRNISGVLNSG